ncbi:uncharacterized protein LOC121271012 [Carcharodon carcharias]|uniref:uncharacterized protein LOC121271012 n=1 Tax=Carcharodon carcharias TaxID=13397 RepID=UPI001B7E96CB|nr:uncharacterized protein LOC121271012 [Carcharodon carcharias]
MSVVGIITWAANRSLVQSSLRPVLPTGTDFQDPQYFAFLLEFFGSFLLPVIIISPWIYVIPVGAVAAFIILILIPVKLQRKMKSDIACVPTANDDWTTYAVTEVILMSGKAALLKVLLCQVVLNVDQFDIRVRETHVTGVLGKSVVLSVHEEGPIRRITWDKGKQRFLNCQNGDGHKIFGRDQNRVTCFLECSLQLSDLQMEDRGVYLVTAVTADGQTKNQSIYLDLSGYTSPRILIPIQCSTLHE